MTISAKKLLEHKFAEAIWRAKPAGVPMPERQFLFHAVRRWRFDFAWPEIKLAIEIHGGNFSFGGHNRGAQQAKDYEKGNEAILAGWRVLQFGTKQMGNPLDCANMAIEVLFAIAIERSGRPASEFEVHDAS